MAFCKRTVGAALGPASYLDKPSADSPNLTQEEADKLSEGFQKVLGSFKDTLGGGKAEASTPAPRKKDNTTMLLLLGAAVLVAFALKG